VLSLIAALAENRVIGRAGQLPWRLSADLVRFRKLTMGHHVIMGRKTYQSLPSDLPGRKLVVLSRDAGFAPQDCQVATCLADAIGIAKDDHELFVIGGESVFAEAIPLATRLYLTQVHASVDGDTFFPEFDWSRWTLVEDSPMAADEKNEFSYSFRRYEKNTENV